MAFRLPPIPRRIQPQFAEMGGGILAALGSMQQPRFNDPDSLIPDFAFPGSADSVQTPPRITMPEEAENPTGLGLGEMFMPSEPWGAGYGQQQARKPSRGAARGKARRPMARRAKKPPLMP